MIQCHEPTTCHFWDSTELVYLGLAILRLSDQVVPSTYRLRVTQRGEPTVIQNYWDRMKRRLVKDQNTGGQLPAMSISEALYMDTLGRNFQIHFFVGKEISDDPYWNQETPPWPSKFIICCNRSKLLATQSLLKVIKMMSFKPDPFDWYIFTYIQLIFMVHV